MRFFILPLTLLISFNVKSFSANHDITVGYSLMGVINKQNLTTTYENGLSASYAYQSTPFVSYVINYSEMKFDLPNDSSVRYDKAVNIGGEFGQSFKGRSFTFRPFFGTGAGGHSKDGVGGYASVGFRESFRDIITSKFEYRMTTYSSFKSQYQLEIGFRF